MSVFDKFRHIVTTKDVPILKEDLEFEVHLSSVHGERSYVPPIKITFLCEKITYDRDSNTAGVRAMSVPCLFTAHIPESDTRIKPGTMEFNFGKIVNKTVFDFFQTIMLCKNSEETTKYFGSDKIHIEKIKSLTEVYERKVLTEKHHKKKNGHKKTH